MCSKEDEPSVEEAQVREHLNKLGIRKSMGPDRMHPRERFLRTGRKCMSRLSSRRARRRIWGTAGWSASPHHPEVMEQSLLETTSRYMEGKKVIGSRHGFMNGKKRSINPPAFCQEMTGSVEDGTAADAAYLHFGMAFDTASRHSLADKLVKQGLGKWTVRTEPRLTRRLAGLPPAA